MAIATPLQIVVSRDGDDRRTDVYVNTLRLAFEGSSDAASSPSAYLADAVDLGVRVLEPAADIEEPEIGTLVGGAQETVVVVIGKSRRRARRWRAPWDWSTWCGRRPRRRRVPAPFRLPAAVRRSTHSRRW